MAKMFNRARMTVTSTGTGALSLGVAVAGYQTFSSAGAQNGDSVSYAVEDGLKWEIGTGTYNSVAGTLSRTVTQSFDGTTYGTSAISVTTSAQVFISPLAADLQYGTSAGNLVQLDGSARLPAVDGSLVTALNASNISSGTIDAARVPTLNQNTTGTAANVTGTVAVANGGTGLTLLSTGYIPYGNGTSAFNSNQALTFDGAIFTIGYGSTNRALQIRPSAGYSGYIQFTENAVNDRWSLGCAAGNADFIWKTGSAFTGSEKMRLSSGGQLVVGATSAFANIDAVVSGGSALGGTAQLAIGASATDFEHTYFRIDNSGYANFSIDQKYGGVNYSRLFIERITGSVGLGVTNPSSYSARLAINGNVSIIGGSKLFFWDSTNTYTPSILASGNNLAFVGNSGTTQATLDSAGNLGLGAVPSVWRSGARAFQSGGNGYVALWEQANGAANLSFGVYEGSANTFNYRTTGDAPTLYSQLNGAHKWYNASSGTANNTFSFGDPKMTLDASGILLIGGTSAYVGSTKLEVTGAGANPEIVARNTAGAERIHLLSRSAVGTSYVQSQNSFLFVGTYDNYAMGFTTNNTERMRIDSGGYVAINTTTSSNYRLKVGGNIYATGYIQAEGAIYTTGSMISSNSSVNPVTFGINDVEKMRISTDGTFRVKGAGTAGSSDAFQVSGSAPANAAQLDGSGNLLVGTTSNTNSAKTVISGGTLYNQLAVTISTSGTTLFNGVGGIMTVRANTTGGTALVIFDVTTGVVIASQSGSIFTTSAPTANQIQISTGSSPFRVIATAGSSKNNETLNIGTIICQ